MTVLIVIAHVVVCLALIMIVLLQTGKGADMGAVFGGAGSQTLFGSTGATTFLGKLTTGAAIIFMLTSLSLAYISKGSEKSVVSGVKTSVPQPPETIPVPAVPVPAPGTDPAVLPTPEAALQEVPEMTSPDTSEATSDISPDAAAKDAEAVTAGDEAEPQ